ncbi:MAG: hypothetical protein IJA87_06170 [Clostridia bacterium]|nr:hypothetical protein [Clostridia bacterium]
MDNTFAAYFLASNSGKGFYSLFNELYSPHDGWNLYILKGGPGTGKSSIMKKMADVADNKGYYCEKIYCSSDPDSLDGIIIPELKVSVADGTAPHIIEPTYPGVSEKIINLGDCWDESCLKKNGEHIITLTDCNKALHKRSSRYISAAYATLNENIKILASAFIEDKADNFVTRYITRYAYCNNSYGKETKRFIDATTPKGIITLADTALNLCDIVISITDEYSAVSGFIMNKMRNFSLSNGIDIITLLNPINPAGAPRHIILKKERVGFFTSDSFYNFKPFASRNINAKRFIDDSIFKAHKAKISFNKKLSENLNSEAISILFKAKSVHDDLEKYYVNATDFDKVNELTEHLIYETFN